MSTDDYAPIVDELINGIIEPALLIGLTRSRMQRLAELHRFEDAALVRDRWISLTRAIHRNRVWNAFQDAGKIEASGPGGVTLLISHGRMEVAWPSASTRPHALTSATEPSAHPPSMAAIDEALLLWQWLARSPARIASVDGVLALPASEIPDLSSFRATSILAARGKQIGAMQPVTATT
jgi:DNA polymerase-3 subunit epsilon